MSVPPADLAVAGLGAAAAGAVNALAGGGTLITFPLLLALGLPAVGANVTSTVALLPGYFGAGFAQRRELAGQRVRLIALLPAALVGGFLGAFLLLRTGERAFRQAVPFLILLASALLAAQDLVRKWFVGRNRPNGAARPLPLWAPPVMGLAASYGGYFGAGVSVIVLALLGVMIDDSITRLNALKQFLALAINVAAAGFFLFSGQVAWPVAAIMAAGAIAGGVLGGRVASRIKPAALRWLVVVLGVVVGLIYLTRR